MATQNSLGLDFDQLSVQDASPPQPDVASSPHTPTSNAESKHEKAEKKKPYVNAERVKTGGPQRDKLSDEALAERMARMKEQNEKIKQRRLDVQADEEAFRKTQEAERAKHAQNRKVQEGVDRTREQNAKRKMDKIQSREWDSGKPAGDWKQQSKKGESTVLQVAAEGASKPDTPAPTVAPASPPRDSGNWVRGSPRSGARGRGRGRGQGSSANQGPLQNDHKPPAKTESPLATDSTKPTTSPTAEMPKVS
ncbi:hypothetical protein H2248_009728 [Termitomyces sp. 'cryptogamus']|nr:hypothetical protein H2248_009728 [Termitomyces sp. 'cryptogamus']